MAVQLAVRSDDHLVERVGGSDFEWRSCLGPYPAEADCDDCGRPCRGRPVMICEEDPSIVAHLACVQVDRLPVALSA